MISKPKVTAMIVFSVLAGLVLTPVFADRYRPTPAGPNRWKYEREELLAPEEIEAMKTPAEENLIDSTYNTVAGTTYATGKSITGTANAAGEALVGTAEAGGRTLGGAADAVTGTAGAAYRTVMGGEEPVEEEQMEDVAIEQPKEKNLFEASWGAIAGTAGAIGRTFGAVYASVFPVKEAEEAESVEPQTRTHRFVFRRHGMTARRVRYQRR